MDDDDGQANNYRADVKHLAKNTVFRYLQQNVVLLVSLYAARIVLQGHPETTWGK